MTNCNYLRALVWSLASFGCADAATNGVGPMADSSTAMGGQSDSARAGSSAQGGSGGASGTSAQGGDAGDAQAGSSARAGGAGEVQDGGRAEEGGTTKPELCGPGGTALFCEGFENPVLDPAWNPVSCDPVSYPGGNPNSTGSQKRDTNRASSGLGSWHAHVDFGSDPPAGGSCQAELRRAVTFPTPDAFLRMFVYVPAGKVPFEFNMLTDGHGFFAVGLDYPLGPLHAGGYENSGSPVNSSSTAPFPTDRWVCVEWQLHQGSNASLTAWQEGVTVIDRAPVAFPAGAHLDSLFFGIYVGNSQNSTADLWLDDLALSATRIGCTGH